jgi:hypothetical protein
MVLTQKNRHKDYWNGIEDPDKKTHAATAIWFFTKEPKIYLGEKTFFSTNGAWKTRYPHEEDWNWIPVFHPVLISIQSGLKILIKYWNFPTTTRKNRENSGTYGHRQGLPE